MGDIALRVFDHARQTCGDHETRVDVIDISVKRIKEGRALKKTMYHDSACTFYLSPHWVICFLCLTG